MCSIFIMPLRLCKTLNMLLNAVILLQLKLGPTFKKHDKITLLIASVTAKGSHYVTLHVY